METKIDMKDYSVDTLNKYCCNKRVIFVSNDGEHYKNGNDFYVTKNFIYTSIGIQVNMQNGSHGRPKSLIFIDPIFFDKNKKIKNLKIDPFEEENWGYEEI